jgi:hypothetical protein
MRQTIFLFLMFVRKGAGFVFTQQIFSFMKKLSVLFYCLLLSTLSFSQVVYGLQKGAGGSNGPFNLVGVNPFLAQPDSIFPISGSRAASLGSSTFDHANQRYIFWGYDYLFQLRFYTLDVINGTVVNSPVATASPVEVQYDLQNQVPYGLEWDPSTSTEYLVTLDLVNGATTNIAALPGVEAVTAGSATFDSNHGRYFFQGVDNNQTFRYYSVDLDSGTILQSPVAPSNGNGFIRSPKYDLNTDKIFCLWTVIDSTQPLQPGTQFPYANMYFAELDSITGAVNIVNPSPVLSGYDAAYQVGSTDFDQTTQTYLVVGKDDTTNGFHVILIDATDGSILSSTPMPAGRPIYELEIDNQSFAARTYQGNQTAIEREGSPGG